MKKLIALILLVACPVIAQETGPMRGPQQDYETEVQPRTSAIPSTPVLTAVPRGLYSVCLYQQIIRVASSTSSLQAIVTWNNGSPQSSSADLTADTSNALNSFKRACFQIGVADQTDINAQVNYSSTGATTMQYIAYIRVKREF